MMAAGTEVVNPDPGHPGLGRGWCGLLAAGVIAAWELFGSLPLAEACAVCFGGQDSDWTGGFLLGTVVMLILPPAIIGGAVFAIYRAIKREDARVAEVQSDQGLSAGSSDVVRG